MGKIYGNTIGGVAPVNVFELELEDGTVLNGVVTDEPPVITARPKDIRIGKTAILGDGIVEGENTITYRTSASSRLILPGKTVSLVLKGYDQYDYTKIQCIITMFQTEYIDNVVVKYITIEDSVFSIETLEKISNITKNNENKSIDLNIVNTSEDVYEVFFTTYREEE